MASTEPKRGLSIIILGGGIAGLTTSLALTKFAPSGAIPDIKIFEIRPEPATIGGAVNLTPNALRLLDHLGALEIIRQRDYGMTINAVEFFDLYSGKLGESSFRGPTGEGLGNPPYKALRITRGDALKGVLAAVEKHDNISMTCGKKTVDIKETDSNVKVTFEDGSTETADILIGADGIHSVTRLKHVEPARKAIYSGVCNAFGFASRKVNDPKVHFECTGINFARRGMLLTSFHSSKQDSVYVGALLQKEELGDRSGWKVAGSDAEAIRKDMHERFSGAANDIVPKVIEDAQGIFLWPVFTLPKGGKWATNRVMLIGDAAHAMPPQGESTGIVFEDTVLFSRCLCRWMEAGGYSHAPVKEAFDAYESLRRARIDAAFEESKSVVRTVSDAGWFGHFIKCLIVPWFLYFTRASREKHFVEDVTTSELSYNPGKKEQVEL